MDESSDDSVPLHAEDIESQLDEGGKPFDQVDSVDDAEELGGDYYWFRKYCKILIAMCFFGGLSAFIGYVLAPECSDADIPLKRQVFSLSKLVGFVLQYVR